MRQRLCVIVLRALIGYCPPRWLRPAKIQESTDMVALTAPIPYQMTAADHARIIKQVPPYAMPTASEAGKLEGEAERLQLEVKAAAVRNSIAVEHGVAQADSIKTFEERARDTLRDMLEDMGKDK